MQSELDRFFANLRNRADSLREVSAQAFSQARYKISALVFSDVNRHLMDLVETHLPTPRWHGLRIVAGDGSKVRLTVMSEGVRSIVEGMAFGLLLPDRDLFLHFALHEPLCDERQMLVEGIDTLNRDDLLILDRGFPSRWLIRMLTEMGVHFCIRCDSSGGFNAVKAFMASGLTERLVCLPAPDRADAEAYQCLTQPTIVRLVRVVTPNGRIHVVMTSLLDSLAYPSADFARLYHGRWRIEEGFKRLKLRLGLEHTSGLSWHAARQDFGAKAVCDNLNALAVCAAENAYLDADSPCKINRTVAFDKIKRQIGRWLLMTKATVRSVKALLADLALNLQQFVPERARPRVHRRKSHRFFAYKSA